MQATCAHCGDPFTPRTKRSRCCSARCSSAYFRNSGEPCTHPGCDRNIRAKGLCATHYNQQHQPDRHAKVETPCTYCGTILLKEPTSKYERRYCSMTCQNAWQLENMGRPPGRTRLPRKSTDLVLVARQDAYPWGECKIPRGHPVRPRSTNVQWHSARCLYCEARFISPQPHARYCDERCSKRMHRQLRTAREHGAHGTFTWAEFMRIYAAFDRKCAYCELTVQGMPDPDHVLPLSRGGANTIANLLPACRSCNADKGDLTLAEWTHDRQCRRLPPVTTTWPATDPRIWHLSLSQPTRASTIPRKSLKTLRPAPVRRGGGRTATKITEPPGRSAPGAKGSHDRWGRRDAVSYPMRRDAVGEWLLCLVVVLVIGLVRLLIRRRVGRIGVGLS